MKIIVHRAKHCTYYYKASTPEEIESSSLEIMKYNLSVGYYSYPDGLEEKVKAEIDSPSGKAWRFIRSRSGNEYEDVSIEEVR